MPVEINGKLYYKIQEVAKMLGMARQSIYYHIGCEHLHTVPGTSLIILESLIYFIEGIVSDKRSTLSYYKGLLRKIKNPNTESSFAVIPIDKVQ